MADFFITQQPTAVWEANNPTLQANELGVCSDLRNGIETDTGIARLGNGVDAWDDLPNFNPTASSQALFSYLDTTVTYNNVDVLADTSLSVTVAAGGIYDIDLVIHSTNSLSAGVNFDFAGTSTQTNFIGQWRSGVAVPNDFDHGARITAAGTDYTDVSLNGGTVSGYYTFRGTVEVNVGGTFLLRSAQSSAVAENVSILRGSSLTLTKRN